MHQRRLHLTYKNMTKKIFLNHTLVIWGYAGATGGFIFLIMWILRAFRIYQEMFGPIDWLAITAWICSGYVVFNILRAVRRLRAAYKETYL